MVELLYGLLNLVDENESISYTSLAGSLESELSCYASVCAHSTGAITAAAEARTMPADRAQAAAARAQHAMAQGVVPPSPEALSAYLDQDPGAAVWSDTLCSSLPLTKHLAQVLSVGFEGLQHVVQLQPWLLQVEGKAAKGLHVASGLMRFLSWMVQVRSGSAEAWGSAVGRDAL